MEQQGQPPPVTLDSKSVVGFERAKTYNWEKPISSLDFSDDGSHLVATGLDDSVRLYSVDTAECKRISYCKRLGVSLVRFTHHARTVLCAPRRADSRESIRCLALHDNRYVRFFPGHSQEVTQIDVHPTNDTFMSGANDRTIRFWDMRVEKPTACMHTKKSPLISYDRTGTIFGALTRHSTISLFDCRKYQKGPFSTKELARDTNSATFTSLNFFPDEESIYLSLSTGNIISYDAYDLTKLKLFEPERGTASQKRRIPARFMPSISPDNKYILSGSQGGLHVWDAGQGGTPSKTWLTEHSPGPRVVRWNHVRCMFVSGGNTLDFWLPPQ